jgi:predicted ATPase/class 3 adenylate cyclase
MLFTDIEGSTRLAAALGSGWTQVLREHHAVVGGEIAAEGGWVERTEGDAFFAVFGDPRAGARAAVAGLRALRAHRWPEEVGELRVRMGLHVGFVERNDLGYVGLEIHRAARVGAAAHGGQLLMTAAARAVIGEHTATEPLGMHRLKDFPAPEALFCAVVDDRGAAAFPPPRTQELRPTNLPAGTPRLVGRDDDLRRVRDALIEEGERFVTVTGRGGAGKTSLALVAATGMLDDHPGGVWLVRLANVAAVDDVLPAMATAVGAELGASPSEALIARLRDRGATLLVLDNLEHVLAAGPAVAELLDALPDLRVLCTSQAPVRIAAERCLPLDALDDESALALIERVARRRGATGGGDRGALLELVRLLDGLPLALELAAARLALLTPAQLHDRLRESPDVLQDAGADRPDRQRSLGATVDWALEMLDDGSRALFARMGAFAGPVELEDLEAVTGGDGVDPLEDLAVLVDVALARRVERGDGRVRFGLPEALRQIAAAQLDAAPRGQAWRGRHAPHQLEIVWAARLGSLTTGGRYRRAADADPEAAAALSWARAQGDPLAVRLAAARGTLLPERGGARPALAVLEPLLATPSGDPLADAQALIGQCYALLVMGRIDEVAAPAERAMALTADRGIQALAYLQRSLAHTFGGAGEAGLEDALRCTAMAREVGPAALASALVFEAQARLHVRDFDGAARTSAEAERIGARADAKMLWHMDTGKADLALLTGRPQDALLHYVLSIEAAQARGDELQVLFDLFGIALALANLGDDTDALAVHAMAEAQGEQIGGPDTGAIGHLLGQDPIVAAEARVGAAAAAEAKARGGAAPAAQRVTRACRLARARQAA